MFCAHATHTNLTFDACYLLTAHSLAHATFPSSMLLAGQAHTVHVESTPTNRNGHVSCPTRETRATPAQAPHRSSHVHMHLLPSSVIFVFSPLPLSPLPLFPSSLLDLFIFLFLELFFFFPLICSSLPFTRLPVFPSFPLSLFTLFTLFTLLLFLLLHSRTLALSHSCFTSLVSCTLYYLQNKTSQNVICSSACPPSPFFLLSVYLDRKCRRNRLWPALPSLRSSLQPLQPCYNRRRPQLQQVTRLQPLPRMPTRHSRGHPLC